MPIAAFTFGSFGDIATILQLCWSIRQSLSETAGAVAQVETLLADIDAFTNDLQKIQAALNRRLSVPTDLLNGIAHALEQCFQLLTGLKLRMDGYNARMTPAVGARGLKQYWAVLGWDIFGGKSKVLAMRARLSEQIEVIQTLLAAAQSENLDEIKKVADNIQKAAEENTTSLDATRKDAYTAHLHVCDMFASMREFCVRLSATSAAFTFFDDAGAQILPLGTANAIETFNFFLPRRRDEDHYTREGKRRWATTITGKGLFYVHLQYNYCPNIGWVVPDVEYGNASVLRNNANKYTTLDMWLFLHTSCDNPTTDADVDVFFSPIYARDVSSARCAIMPDLSSALSPIIRSSVADSVVAHILGGPTVESGTFDRDKHVRSILDLMVTPRDVHRMLNLESFRAQNARLRF